LNARPFSDSEHEGGMLQQELFLGEQQDHFRPRWHRLPGLVSSGDLRGLDGSDGGCSGCAGGGPATAKRGESLCLPVLCHIHCLRFILHAEPLHWSDHRQFQYAEEKGERRALEFLLAKYRFKRFV